jgi:predicted DCC family thiol-disulfide oxidoreductase YuxK
MPSSATEPETPHWLIWDGDCGFCANAVAWFTDRDRERCFQPVMAQTCPSPPMTDARRDLATRAMIVVTRDGRKIIGGRAVLFVLREIGWRPALVGLASRRPFLWAVGAGYRVVARYRQLFSHILFRRDGPRGACSIRPE